MRDAFEARAIAYWRKVYAALPSDPLDRRGLNAVARIPYPKEPSGAVVAMATPSLDSIGDLASRMEVERRLTRAALDLEAGRNAPLPRDPFGSGPLRVRRGPKGWTLWSVGPDGIDQGGKVRKGDGAAYDLVVAVP